MEVVAVGMAGAGVGGEIAGTCPQGRRSRNILVVKGSTIQYSRVIKPFVQRELSDHHGLTWVGLTTTLRAQKSSGFRLPGQLGWALRGSPTGLDSRPAATG